MARLREAKEIVEEDSDMNYFFSLARSNRPLSRKFFLEQFSKSRALRITWEQLKTIEMLIDKEKETKGQRFSYISLTGEKITITADEMEGIGTEEFNLLLEELGDEPSSSEYPELAMYFDPQIARLFAKREQNDKNFQVADLLDRVIMAEIKHLPDPLKIAELGGGAHPDRYDRLFARLLGYPGSEPQGIIDWVDVSPYMLEYAEDVLKTPVYEDRKNVIRFFNRDLIKYLQELPDHSLDVVIMKYMLNYVPDLETLFALLARKIKMSGRFVATMGPLSPELRGHSTNARYFYKGEAIPDDETRRLEDGESYMIRFLQESGNPDSGFLEGAETTVYYHSPEKIESLAAQFGFDYFLGDWKKIITNGQLAMDQDVLILRK